MSSSHNGYAGSGQNRDLASHIKDSQGIVDFFEARWIGTISNGHYSDADVGCARHFLASQFH